jgi:hypothetical protein
MIPLEPNSGRVDCEKLDRLVDDELPEAERAELLTELDSVPGGWRRCAMTFLEAQSWHKELSAIVGEKPAATEPQILPRATRSPRRSVGWLATRTAAVLAMAASFVAALWLGWAIQDLGHTIRVPEAGPAELAESAPATEIPIDVKSLAQTPSQRPSAPNGPWQMVTLSADGSNGQGGRTFDLPACEQQRLDNDWTESLPSALPLDVLESLRRTGYRVRQHRELLPMEMNDGRRLVVPVEEVEVEYAGHPSL